MNERIEHCLYQAGLTAQGCWDELDEYAKNGIEKFAQLIVQECADYIRTNLDNYDAEPLAFTMEMHFGVHGDYAE